MLQNKYQDKSLKIMAATTRRQLTVEQYATKHKLAVSHVQNLVDAGKLHTVNYGGESVTKIVE